jgi:hypothetical protein
VVVCAVVEGVEVCLLGVFYSDVELVSFADSETNGVEIDERGERVLRLPNGGLVCVTQRAVLIVNTGIPWSRNVI